MSMILKKKRTYVNPTMRIVQLEPTGNLMSVSNPEGSGEDMPWGRSRRLKRFTPVWLRPCPYFVHALPKWIHS